jgi:hypothetical protein
MPPDIAQFATVSPSSVFAAYVLTTLVKPLVEQVWATTSPLHDWAIRLLSCVFGVVIVTVATAILHPLTGQTGFNAVTAGIEAGLSAIGTYHILSTAAPAPAEAPQTVMPTAPVAPTTTSSPGGAWVLAPTFPPPLPQLHPDDLAVLAETIVPRLAALMASPALNPPTPPPPVPAVETPAIVLPGTP